MKGLMCALCAAALAVPVAAAAETLRLTTQEWKPYQYSAGTKVEGIAVKAVTCVLEKMGHQADIVVLPWMRAQLQVAGGEAVGFFAASKSADRDAYAEMSRAFIPQVWGWYQLAEKSFDPADKALKVGVLAGSSMEKWLDDNGYAATSRLQATEQLVKMLRLGRLDVVLANEIVFKEAVSVTGSPEAAFKMREHSNRPLGVYFGKAFLTSHPGFLDAFNARVTDCR